MLNPGLQWETQASGDSPLAWVTGQSWVWPAPSRLHPVYPNVLCMAEMKKILPGKIIPDCCPKTQEEGQRCGGRANWLPGGPLLSNLRPKSCFLGQVAQSNKKRKPEVRDPEHAHSSPTPSLFKIKEKHEPKETEASSLLSQMTPQRSRDLAGLFWPENWATLEFNHGKSSYALSPLCSGVCVTLLHPHTLFTCTSGMGMMAHEDKNHPSASQPRDARSLMGQWCPVTRA